MLNHIGTLEIKTERLLLRRFNLSDEKDMFNNWASDDNVTKYLSWPTHTDTKVTKSVLTSWVEAYSNKENYHWGIVPINYGRVVGSISVVDISNIHDRCEIGYCIGKNFWNKGITSEALKAVIEFLFNEIGFERIQAIHHKDNVASGKVMKKAGMVFEGRLRNFHNNKDNAFVDCDMYSILNTSE